MAPVPKTDDGYTWTPDTGVTAGGLECDAVITPRRSVPATATLYDVIVIGAGYAGLMAARDLTALGMFCNQSISIFINRC